MSDIRCHNCKEMLHDFTKGKIHRMPFKVPIACREPNDHTSDYFCTINMNGVDKSNQHEIFYPCIFLVIWPILHSKEHKVLIFNGFSSSEHEDCKLSKKDDEVCDNLQEYMVMKSRNSSPATDRKVISPLAKANRNRMTPMTAILSKSVIFPQSVWF